MSNQSLKVDTQILKIDLNENKTSTQMCEEKYKKIIYKELGEYMEENYEKGKNVEEMVEEAIQSLWNGYYTEKVVEDYEHIIFFLKLIKENIEDYGEEFKDYDDPQKIFNVGIYILSRKVCEDFIQSYDIPESDSEDEEQQFEIEDE